MLFHDFSKTFFKSMLLPPHTQNNDLQVILINFLKYRWGSPEMVILCKIENMTFISKFSNYKKVLQDHMQKRSASPARHLTTLHAPLRSCDSFLTVNQKCPFTASKGGHKKLLCSDTLQAGEECLKRLLI